MKKIISLILPLFAVLLMISCEEDQTGPVVSTTDAIKPAISSPANESTLVLTKPDESVLFVVEWSAADYKVADLPSVKYSLDIESPDNQTKMSLTSTDALLYQISYKNLNLKLVELGLAIEQSQLVILTVTASMSDFSTADDLVSTAVNVYFTPYDDTPPPANPIYLLGNATLAGWSNTAALEMSHIEAGKFEITTTLTGGSGNFIKFIADLGKWAPQWGTDASGIWSSGNLVYRPTEAVPDPPAIPAPPTSGDYHIVADTALLNYQVEAVASKIIISTGLNGEKIEMEKVKPLVFTITTKLSAGNDLYINFEEESSHRVYYNMNSIEKPAKGKTIFSYIDMYNTGLIINSPQSDGEYTIDINLKEMTYKLTKK